MAAELHFTGVLFSLDLKRITVLQPVIRDFDLISVLDLLAEHTVVVADAAAVCRIVQGGKGIQETCGKTAQTAVAQSRVPLLIFDVHKIVTQLLKSLFNDLLLSQSQDSIAQGAPHQELHGHVIELLDLFLIVGPVGEDPVVDDGVLDRQRHRMVHHRRIRFLDSLSVDHAEEGFNIILQLILGHGIYRCDLYRHSVGSRCCLILCFCHN